MGSHSGAIVTAAAARAILVIATILQSVYGQTCGGSLTGSGTIKSPNYPANYPSNANCVWNLTSSDGNSAIQLFFGNLNIASYEDILEVYSGGIPMEQYQTPTPAHTAVYSSNVTVVFRAASSGEFSGFSIVFNSTSPRCGVACFTRRCITWTPNFPYPFPKGSSCHWTIDAGTIPDTNGGFLAVESTTVSPTPFTGTFEIIRDYSNGSQAVDTYRSPARIPPVTLGEQLAEITFTSDRCFSGTGFMLSFSKLTTQCGEQLVGNGTFSTTNYPNDYYALTICVWRLTAMPGMRVQLEILDLNVESGYDFVRIYSDDQLVGSYTGSYDPFSLTLGSEVILVFQSDPVVSTRGLLASFISVQ